MPTETPTGRGVRVAIVDSGVHATHPHVAGVVGGLAIAHNGSTSSDFVDRIGHGTAVAAAIHEKAPGAELFPIKVFWEALSTDVATLVRAIEMASENGAHLINLSLGTRERRHRADLDAAVGQARRRGSFVVSAAPDAGGEWLPGALEDVVPVELDWTCDRDCYRVADSGARRVMVTSGYPRDIPGVPRERNLKGLSFAVANATGFIACALERQPTTDVGALLVQLERNTYNQPL